MSDATRDLFMSIGFDGASAARGIDTLNRKIDNTKDNIDNIGSKLGTAGASFKTQMDGLDKSFTLWEKNSGQFATTMERKQKRIDLVKDRTALLEREIDRTSTELAEATREFGANSEAAKRLENQLLDLQIQQAEYNNELKRLASFDWDGFGRLGDKFTGLGTKMSLAVTTPLAGIATVGIKTFIDLEDAWAGVEKVTSGTSEELANLRQQMHELVTDGGVPLSVTEMYGIAQAAGRLGIEMYNVKGFSETVAMLGTVTNMTAEQAATDLAQFATVMQMPQEQFDQLGATLVGLGNNMATTESDIMRMGARLTGAGTAIGLAEAEVLGFSAAFSSLGINAEAGGTAFTNVMLTMQDSIFNMDERLDTFAYAAGKSVEEFADLFQRDAASAIVYFIEGLGNLTEAGYNTNEIFAELGFNGVNVTDLLRRGASSGDTLREAIELANTSWEENTALTIAAGKRYDTTAAQIQVFRNRLTLLSEQIGSDLQHQFRGLIDMGSRFVEWLSGMNDGTRKTLVTFGMVAAAIGPVLIGIGMAIKAIKQMKETVTTLGKGFKAIKGAFTGGGKALMFLASPLGKVILVIGALIAIGVLLYKNWDTITEKASNLWSKIKAAFSNISSWIQETIGNAVSFISDRFPLIGSIIQLQADNMRNIIGGVRRVFGGIVDFVAGVFTGDWGRAWQGVKDVFAGIFITLTSPLNVAKTAFLDISSWIQKTIGNAVSFISDRFPLIGSIIQLQADNMRNIIGGVRRVFGGIVDFVAGVFTGDWGRAWQGVKDVFAGIFITLTSPLNVAKTAFSEISDWIKETIGNAVTFISERFPFAGKVIQLQADNIRNIIYGVKRVFGGIVNFVTGVFTKDWERAWTRVRDVFGAIFSTLGNLILSPLNAAIRGINNINIDVPSWVPGLGGKTVGLNIPTIPGFAKGTNYHTGGPAIVGEEGPELINLPKGTSVISNDKTNRILTSLGQKQISSLNIIDKTPSEGQQLKTKPASSNINKLQSQNLHGKALKILGRANRQQPDSYNANKFDNSATSGLKQQVASIINEFEVVIEKIVIGGDAEVTGNKIDELKGIFKTLFAEAWEEAWYELCLKYPNITDA